MIKGLTSLFIRSFIFLSLLAILSASGAFLLFNHLWHKPLSHNEDQLIDIAKGTNHIQLAKQLSREGYVPSPWYYTAFRFGFSIVEQESFAPKAGEFLIPARASTATLFAIIDKGIPHQHRLAVIEGISARDVVIMLNKEKRMTGAVLRIPQEGSLAPDTYFFVKGTNRADMIARMQARQELILAEEWANRGANATYDTPEEALIMASIIEKESGLAQEQPLVASVFLNRIAKNMRLQSDATVLYGIIEAEGAHRQVLKSDLEKDSPWNTYRRKGYPASAIGNPSRGVINAALNPMPSQYFYFVADGQGGHKFAKTYQEHKKNVRAYRRALANQKQE